MAIYLPPAGFEALISYRVYEDSVSLNGAPALAYERTPALIPWNTPFRIRFRLARDVGIPTSYYLLEYKVGASGQWRACKSGESAYIALSNVFEDGETTTERLTGGEFPFGGGEGIETQRSSAQYTTNFRDYELEYNLRLTSLPVGTEVYFRIVALSQPWNGQDDYTARYLVYLTNALVIIASTLTTEVHAMFGIYTEIGLGRESTSNVGKPTQANRKINATTRLPYVNPETLVWGGFRGYEAPSLVLHGNLAPYTFTLSSEFTPQLASLLLCLLLGTPSTTGTSDPYEHVFSPTGAPRTATLWQRIHIASDESGNPPIYVGYSGVVCSGFTLSLNPSGGICVAEMELQGLTYIMHNSASATNMSGATFFAGRPFVLSEATLTVRDSSGNSPSWVGEITSLRLSIRRAVFPKWGFTGKRVATGWRSHRRAVISDLSMDVYRVGAKPLKLVMGQAENASYPLVPSENVQVYNPSTGYALEITLAYSDNSNNRRVVIQIPQVAWVLSSIGPGGEEPDYDTYTLIPLLKGTNESNLHAITIRNDVATPWSDDPVVTSLPTTPYLP